MEKQGKYFIAQPFHMLHEMTGVWHQEWNGDTEDPDNPEWPGEEAGMCDGPGERDKFELGSL